MAYLTGFQPELTNLLTLVVMSVSAIGVVQSLMAKRKIRCACLGTVFNLPMSTVTLVEDSLMAGMAAVMLFMGSHDNNTLALADRLAQPRDAYHTHSVTLHPHCENRDVQNTSAPHIFEH